MSTWLALALPALALQLAQRALDPALARTLALAIVEGPAQRTQVVFCNRRARHAGVAPGMKLAAAQALERELVAIERDGGRERAALQELCCWAYQFSDRIVPFASAGGSGLLIETGASERLFGGRATLRQRIGARLHKLGYRAAGASAPTAAAARVLALARAGHVAAPDAVDPSQLRPALSCLPLHLLGWEEQVNQTLHALGLDTIGGVLELPRDAFARRFGARRLLDLDRMLGTVPDPQPPFVPPERFRARIDLPADLVDASRLLVPVHRLLLLLEGFLRGRGAGATALALHAHHDRRREQSLVPTPIALALAAPERDAQRLLRLFTERLARVRLPDAATVLELELERMAELVPASASFLPPAPGTGAQGFETLQLAETLHARLGPEGVFRLQALGDHRPEFAHRIVSLVRGPAATPVPDPAPAQARQRPLLILPVPRPLQAPAAGGDRPQYRGPLALLAGPERIEAGWWDLGYPRRAAVQRDYFVARNDHGQTLWIYRELCAPHSWFLHGFFG